MKGRVIKFRAWDGEANRMFYPGDGYMDTVGLDFDKQTGQCEGWKVGEGGWDSEVSGAGWHIWRTDEQTQFLMQYTGLKDKNDREIYEGDIVGWFRPSDGVEVEFRNGAFGIESFSEWIILGINAQHFAEVLGNIYEHPHLLDK